MARILITEPNPDVRRMFEHMVRRLGHEPLALWTVTHETAATIDVVTVEPADRASAELAAETRRLNPRVAVVAVTILPWSRHEDPTPDAWLLKPFTLDELGTTIDNVLAQSGRAQPARASTARMTPSSSLTRNGL
jgi:hypothetical protein